MAMTNFRSVDMPGHKPAADAAPKKAKTEKKATAPKTSTEAKAEAKAKADVKPVVEESTVGPGGDDSVE